MRPRQSSSALAAGGDQIATESPYPRARRFEAEYELESPARCASCETILLQVGVVRLMRTSVNFTSALPHRGFVIVCPHCDSILPAALYDSPV